ncbi:MAG: hypothetical protein BEN18_02260 [Epulopiscium sp. Nuni2H_MBin001]|nr:MAG: hypothetical protein BEN18_02260 [Epulopiscium sp. Nuni2H_MBin001]
MICIIPARAGSKGLKNKNMQFLANKPMIYHTIDAAIASGIFDGIFVSTDSIQYRDIIESERNVVVIMRDASLAQDTTPTFPVIAQILELVPDNTPFMLCQPTSPLRNANHIKEAYEMYKQTNAPIVSVCKSDKSPALFTTLDADNKLSGLVGVDKNYRRQDAQAMYYPNGAIYISTKRDYLLNKSFFTPQTTAYIMDKKSSLDIDDKDDFTQVIGTRYFDYAIREQETFQNFAHIYDEMVVPSNENLIFGDSRMCGINIDGYTNLAIAGITLHVAALNIYKFITDDTQKVLLALGVNDIIASHTPDEIVSLLMAIVERLQKRSISVIVSTIIHTIYRFQADNDKINEVNDKLKAQAVTIVDPNEILSENNCLLYKYTIDGLHFNDEGKKLLQNFYNKHC